MGSRSAETPKPALAAKGLGVVPIPYPNYYRRRPKKTAKTQPMPSSAGTKVESPPIPTVEQKCGRAKKVSKTPESKAHSAEQVGQKSAVVKQVPGTTIVKQMVRKVIRDFPVLAGAVSGQSNESASVEKAEVGETIKEKTIEDTVNSEAAKDEPMTWEMPLVDNREPAAVDIKDRDKIGKSSNNEEEEESEPVEYLDATESCEELPDAIEPNVADVKSVEGQEPYTTNGKDDTEEEKEDQTKAIENKKPKDEHTGMEEHTDGVVKWVKSPIEEHDDKKIEGLSDQEAREDFEGEAFTDDEAPENKGHAEVWKNERVELNVAAQERKFRKEREIFVGGLDRDSVEEDVRKVFSYAGQVVEVNMYVDPSTNKNKGYAFVQFATKEQATRALAEMKNPVINGKRCGTAPSEGNDTLFLGNICNMWTEEAVKQKLKDYSVKGVENVTLVADPRNEGLSRGFAFLEFSSHAEAMLAYKRLQKPDVIFGHSERTAKVAFAEPLREPDPEVMAQVKSVFIDGLPLQWDEDRVRGQFKIYGEIVRVMLAQNMPTAKRKDFGFVDFTTHEAAVSCVDGVKCNGLIVGNSKVEVRARLLNPLPKMQAVKGGMCGGFRIGHGRSGNLSSTPGRGFGLGECPFKRGKFMQGRGFYPHGPGHGGRMGFSNEHGVDRDLYPPLHGMPNFGRGGMWDSMGARRGPLPAGPYPDRLRHDTTDRDYWNYDLHRRYPYPFEEGCDRSFTGRHFDDPYLCDDVYLGIKRPYYMMDQDPHLAEPSTSCPRLGQLHPVRGNRYQVGSGPFRGNYNGSIHTGGTYSSYHEDDQTYRRRYYY